MNKFEFIADNVTVTISLRRATVGDNMRKSMLASMAIQEPLEDSAEQAVAVIVYPRCLACVVDGEITRLSIDDTDLNGAKQSVKDLTPAEFVNLPGEIGEAWLTAVLELNPSWNLAPLTSEQQTSAEKKD